MPGGDEPLPYGSQSPHPSVARVPLITTSQSRGVPAKNESLRWVAPTKDNH